MSQPKDPARQRFLALTLVRLAGLGLGLWGAATVAGQGGLPAPFGYALLALGAFDLVIFPRLLARKWKSKTP